MGSQFQVHRRGYEGRAGSDASGDGVGNVETDGSEFGVAVGRTQEPIRPQHGFETAADGVARLGEGVGDGKWDEGDAGRRNGGAKRRAAARVRLEALPSHAAREIDHEGGRHQKTGAATDAGIPVGLHIGAEARCGAAEKRRDRNAVERRLVVGPAEVGFGAEHPLRRCLPIVAAERAKPRSGAIIWQACCAAGRDCLGA